MVQWGRPGRCHQLTAAAVESTHRTAGVGVEATACRSPRTWHDSLWTHPVSHSRLTHSNLFSGDDQPTCSKCDAVLTVKHILLDCPELWDVWLKYFTASSSKDIFESVINQTVIDFIKDTNFYHQLYCLLFAFYSSYKALFINHFPLILLSFSIFIFNPPSRYSIFVVAYLDYISTILSQYSHHCKALK